MENETPAKEKIVPRVYRIPKSMDDSIKSMAKENGSSATHIVKKAVSFYLESVAKA